jgi:hypothetical protein
VKNTDHLALPFGPQFGLNSGWSGVDLVVRGSAASLQRTGRRTWSHVLAASDLVVVLASDLVSVLRPRRRDLIATSSRGFEASDLVVCSFAAANRSATWFTSPNIARAAESASDEK